MNRQFYKISKEQFEKDFEGINDMSIIKLPKRGTEDSAGYDFFSPFGFTLEPGDVIKIPTGIKVEMPKRNYLCIVPRSSLGFKFFLRLANTEGVIDSDYFNNAKNEGHIWIKIRNEGDVPMSISEGEAIAQGIFANYYITDDDDAKNTRKGGIGSTND